MLKLEPIYLLLSRDMTSDSNDNMNSIIKIVDIFNANISKKDNPQLKEGAVIGLPISFVICSTWHILGKPKEETVTIHSTFEFFNDKDESLGKVENTNEVPLNNQMDRISINTAMSSMIVKNNGDHKVVGTLRVDGKVIATNTYPYRVALEWAE